MERKALEALAKKIIDSSYRVHKELGPGMLENSYEICLRYELASSGIEVERQVKMPITYRDIVLEDGYRLDLYVEKEIVVEVKAVEFLKSVHKAQLLSYLRMSKSRLGLLINFDNQKLSGNVKRVVNGL